MQYHVQQQLGQQKQMIADELAQHRNVLVELSNMFKAVNTSPVTLPVPDQPMTISRPSLSLSRPRDCLTALPQPAAIPNAARLSAPPVGPSQHSHWGGRSSDSPNHRTTNDSHCHPALQHQHRPSVPVQRSSLHQSPSCHPADITQPSIAYHHPVSAVQPAQPMIHPAYVHHMMPPGHIPTSATTSMIPQVLRDVQLRMQT